MRTDVGVALLVPEGGQQQEQEQRQRQHGAQRVGGLPKSQAGACTVTVIASARQWERLASLCPPPSG